MNASLLSCLVVALLGLCCGCAELENGPERRSEALVRELFSRALADCNRAECSPVAAISFFSSHYWLPQSVEPIINEGHKALPVLREMSRSSDFAEKQLASICIELIEAPRLERGNRRTDDKSGITLVNFIASR